MFGERCEAPFEEVSLEVFVSSWASKLSVALRSSVAQSEAILVRGKPLSLGFRLNSASIDVWKVSSLDQMCEQPQTAFPLQLGWMELGNQSNVCFGGRFTQ